MRSRVIVIVTASIVLTLALPVHFVAQTLLADELSAQHHVALLALATFVLVTLVTGIPRRTELVRLGREGIARVALAGFLGIYASQQLVLANRYTDAPPGAEVIFFTTTAWGLIVVLSALAVRSERPSVVQVLLAGIAVVGTIGILANWERPSSFSPFVRYSTENGAMFLAGLGWAGFTLLVAPLGRRHRWRAILPLATGVAAAAGLALAVLSPMRGELVSEAVSVAPQLIVASTTFAAIVISWSWLVSSADVVRPASLLFLPPVLLTVLGVFERKMGAFGPSPLLWDRVWWACAVVVIGALGVALASRCMLLGSRSVDRRTGTKDVPTAERGRFARPLGLTSAALGLLASAASVIALWGPALSAHVVGSRSDGAAYEVFWTVPGAETVGALLLGLASVAALVTAVGFVYARWRESVLLALAAGLVVALLAVPVLATTPLRTWTRWIPAEVQQDYGTEYARLTLEPTNPHAMPLALVAAGGSLLLLCTACLLRIAGDRRRRHVDLADAAKRSENGA